jgi:ribose 5-phosphate isomerase B
MRIYIATDHGGFAHKQALLPVLQQEGYDVKDFGAFTLEPTDDYPAYAHQVAEAVAADTEACGILFCRTGEGMAIAANRHPGVRASVIWNEEVAEETRKKNHANIAVVPSDLLSEAEMLACINRFLTIPYATDERHLRRIAELDLPSHGR